MSAKKYPVCYIVAGPNGAGKTTFALRYLPRVVSCRSFINADEIARGISPLDFDAGLSQAGRIFLHLLAQKLASRETFAFETTLSGRAYIPQIKRWQADGGKVVLIYLYIPGADFSAARVEQRVRQGGHGIPADAIVRRYPRSIRNLFMYANVCDRTFCFDNESDAPSPIFEKTENGRSLITNEKIYSKMLEFC